MNIALFIVGLFCFIAGGAFLYRSSIKTPPEGARAEGKQVSRKGMYFDYLMYRWQSIVAFILCLIFFALSLLV